MNDYYRVDFSIEPHNTDAADLLAAFLADIGFESFQEYDGGISGYVVQTSYDELSVKQVIDSFPMDVSIDFKSELVKQIDWNEEWEKKYFKPILIGDGKCVIHSSFHKDFPHAELEIIVDPKMAFGTGHHATTTMMANHLFKMNLADKRVIDMGAGTGILSIIASKLGAKEVTGIEIDVMAYENAKENIALNNAAAEIRLGDASLLKDYKETDVFLANINRNIILADIDRYADTIKKGGILVLSGFYFNDVPLLEMSLTQYGFQIDEIIQANENWTSIRAIKIR